MLDLQREDGTITLVGNSDQIFELHGVEETDHSFFSQIKGSSEPLAPDTTNISEYDAQEHEYRALRWQIQYAVENKFPENTISVLRNRAEKAQTIRLQKNKGQSKDL